MLTKETLIDSEVFSDWIGTDKVILIHNPYEDGYPSFIVIHSSGDEPAKFSITRFWQSPNRRDQLDKIHVSCDHKDVTAVDVFGLLLKDYSKPLS
jgi:hypothetical protein